MLNCIINILSADQAWSIMSDKPSLLSLPVEIRLQIYSYLDREFIIEYPLSEPYGSQTSFILTCRQLRYEMQHDFFRNNTFAIIFKSKLRMGSTKQPFFKEIHAMAGKVTTIDDLQLPMFHVQRTRRLFDILTLGPNGQQKSTDLRPFDKCSALGNGLAMIEDLQLHMLHWHLHATHPMEHHDMLPEYFGNCKEQLNVVLEALVVLKDMKGPLALKKLTVVDYAPYGRRAWGCATGCLRTKKILKAKLADAYWPVLTQAAATLGISMSNVKVVFNKFPEIDRRMKAFELPAARNGASTKAATREDAGTEA